MNNRGSVLIELLVVLFVMVVLELIMFPHFKINSFHHYYYLNKYQQTQLQAMSKGDKIVYEDNITFNSLGNVNGAKTISINNHEYVIGLGVGRLYEKR